MAIYIIIILLSLAATVYFDVMRHVKGRNWVYGGLCILLILVAGLRWKVGGDTYNYLYYFNTQPDLSQLLHYPLWKQDLSPMWLIFVAVCKSICNNFVFLQIAQAAFVNVSFFVFFRRYSHYPFAAVTLYFLLFFLFYNTEVMRAAMAVSVFLWSYKYLMRKQWWHYTLFVFAAMSFHLEAGVMVLFPLCHLMRRERPLWIILAIGLCLLCYATMHFISFICNHTSSTHIIIQRLNLYSNLPFDLNLKGMITKVMCIIGWMLLIYARRNKETRMRFFIYLGLFNEIMHTQYSSLFGRLNDLVKPILIIWIVAVVWELWETKPLWRFTNFLKVLGVFLICLNYIGNYFVRVADGRIWQRYIPYTHCFNKDAVPASRGDAIIEDQKQIKWRPRSPKNTIHYAQ